jgi:hypothetical protein
MTPTWKRLVLSMLVLQLVIAYVVFSLADYTLWWLQYDQNTGARATKGLLDTAPGVRAAVVFGIAVGALLIVNVVPLLRKPPARPAP